MKQPFTHAHAVARMNLAHANSDPVIFTSDEWMQLKELERDEIYESAKQLKLQVFVRD